MFEHLYDETHAMDLEFDWNIQFKFGSDTQHVSNFDKAEEKMIRDLIKMRDLNMFVDEAYIGNGTEVDDTMIGVYSRSIDDTSKFWTAYSFVMQDEEY